MGKKADSVFADSTESPLPPYEETFHHSTEAHSLQDFTPASTSRSTSTAPFHERLSSLVDHLGFKSGQAYTPVALSDVENQPQPEDPDDVDSGPVPVRTGGDRSHVHCEQCTKLALRREGRQCCLNAVYVVFATLGMVAFFGMIIAIVAIKATHPRRGGNWHDD